MPYSFAHEYCSLEAQRLLPGALAAQIRAESKLFRVGAQGPDIFFYHKTLPFSAKGHFRSFAKKAHSERVESVFGHMLETLSKAEGIIFQKLFAYFAGYLCHYALDCAAHPYVFNRAGIGPDHTRFESDMDVALILYKGKEPQRVYGDLFGMPNEADRGAAGLLLGTALSSCFEDAPGPGDVADAIRSMYRVQKLLLDPHGWKRGAAKLLGRALGSESAFTAAIFPKHPDIRLDSLNLARREWREPWAGGKVSDLRFIDLLERAAVDAADMIRAAHMSLRGGVPMEKALGCIGARSFHTGMDWSRQIEFVELGTAWDRMGDTLPAKFRLPT